jgi:hypothetical protein
MCPGYVPDREFFVLPFLGLPWVSTRSCAQSVAVAGSEATGASKYL